MKAAELQATSANIVIALHNSLCILMKPNGDRLSVLGYGSYVSAQGTDKVVGFRAYYYVLHLSTTIVYKFHVH
jgi:hypothetical protein